MNNTLKYYNSQALNKTLKLMGGAVKLFSRITSWKCRDSQSTKAVVGKYSTNAPTGGVLDLQLY